MGELDHCSPRVNVTCHSRYTPYLPETATTGGASTLSPDLSPICRCIPALFRARTVSGASVARSARGTSKSAQSTPVILEPENFDPTYGLRPEGLPTKSVFSSFGRLFKQNKGLADLTEEQSEVDGEEEAAEEEDTGSYSVADWEDTSIDYSPPPSLTPDDSVTEYETIPAVGGGTITRPRVYHSQSMIQPPSQISRTTTDAGSITTSTPSLRRSISPSQQAGPSRTNSFPLSTPRIPNRGFARSVETSPRTDPPHAHSHESNKPPLLSLRRLSVSSTAAANLDPFHSGSPPPHYAMSEADPNTTLRPTMTNTLHQLSMLSYSNHTLSPYTARRSISPYGPPRTLNSSGVRAPPERRSVKVKSERTYRIGGKPQPQPNPEPNGHPLRTSVP